MKRRMIIVVLSAIAVIFSSSACGADKIAGAVKEKVEGVTGKDTSEDKDDSGGKDEVWGSDEWSEEASLEDQVSEESTEGREASETPTEETDVSGEPTEDFSDPKLSEDIRETEVADNVRDTDPSEEHFGPAAAARNKGGEQGFKEFNSEGPFSDDEILEFAKKLSGAPNAELDGRDPDGTMNIRLYGKGLQDTWDWYYINPDTLTGTNILGDEINLRDGMDIPQ